MIVGSRFSNVGFDLDSLANRRIWVDVCDGGVVDDSAGVRKMVREAWRRRARARCTFVCPILFRVEEKSWLRYCSK